MILIVKTIWRDGLAAWNIPPCKTYLDACAALDFTILK